MSKITAYAALTAPLSDDLVLAVDVHDTTMAPTGTDKKVTVGNLLAGLAPSGDTTGAADTANIQGLLTLAGRVQLAPGIFWIAQTLLMYSGSQLAGAGMGATTIRAKASFAAAQVGSNPGMVMLAAAGNTGQSRLTVTDLTLDMNEAATASVPGYATAALCSPLGFQNVTCLTIDRVEVINAIGYSALPLACTDVRIRGCRIITGQVNSGYGNQDGIHVTDCTGVVIAGNYLDTGTTAGVGDDAIAIQGVTAGCSDVTIAGNVIEHAAAHGISLVLGGATVSDVTITGNIIKNTVSEGLLFFYTTFVSSATYLITDVSVTGNVFRNVGTGAVASGITLQDAFGGTGAHAGTPGYAGVTIAANLLDGFTNSSGFGIYAQAGSGLTISDNTFLNWKAVRGIDIGDNSSSVSRPVASATVSGNTIDMSGTVAASPVGIVVVDSPNAVVTDNSVTGPGTGVAGGIGISLLSIGTAITGAVINDNRARAWASGISETNNGTAPDYNTYVGNNCHGCTAFITIAGTHDIPASANLGTVNVIA